MYNHIYRIWQFHDKRWTSVWLRSTNWWAILNLWYHITVGWLLNLWFKMAILRGWLLIELPRCGEIFIEDGAIADAKEIHTTSVRRSIEARGANRVIGIPAPAISKEEEQLPRKTKRTLVQLRSGFCSPLNDYKHRVRQSNTQICPCCRQEEHTVCALCSMCLSSHNTRWTCRFVAAPRRGCGVHEDPAFLRSYRGREAPSEPPPYNLANANWLDFRLPQQKLDSPLFCPIFSPLVPQPAATLYGD